MKKKINIGLDIGVASIGYSIIDEDANIIQLGSRLFDDVANSNDGTLKNEKRRTMRSLRRRISRTSTRKKSYKKLLVKYGYGVLQQNENNSNNINVLDMNGNNLLDIDITKFGVDNPIELKVKALKEVIPQNQLLFILFHYLHHRGFFYITEDNIKEKKLDMNILPSEALYDFYKKNKYYKNADFSSDFSNLQYLNEINKILEVNNYLDKNFINEYLELFKTVRKFSEGPGNEKSPTKYGLWQLDKDGNINKKYDSLWEALIGKCTYYKEEYRAPKNSPISEIFNLLNDLSNIYFYHDKDKKLTHKDKEEILKLYNDNIHKNKDYKLSHKKLVNIKKTSIGYENISEINIFGFRINSKKESIISEIKNYKSIFQFMLNENIIDKNENMWDIRILEKAQLIFELLKSEDVQQREKNIKTTYPNVKDESLDILIGKKGIKDVFSTHSLSKRAMLEYINYFLNNLENNNNQMVYFSEKNIENNEINFNSKYIPHNLYQDAIISPTTRRAFNQTINVLNKILKLYSNKYDIDNITIELARDKNISEERKNISKSNAKNKEIIDKFKNEFDIDKNKKFNASTSLRIKLWNSQDRRDIYDNSPISYDEVISGHNLDIDHIIPFSVCSDDSINNKVLTHSYNNKDKSNRTPYQWMNSNEKFESFKTKVEDLHSRKLIDRKKLDNLIYSGNPLEDPQGFIGRNISDTRYASKLVLNILQDFFDKKQEIYGRVKVKTVRGQLTNFARYNLFVDNNQRSLIPKNRDLYCHHAIDASIICFLGMNHKTRLLLDNCNKHIKTKTLNDEFKFENGKLIDNETGEVFDIFEAFQKDEKIKSFGLELSKYNSVYDEETKNIISGDKAHNVKYSRMLVRKNNVPLSDETLYSVNWNNEEKTEGNICNSINLLNKDFKKIKSIFYDNENLDNVLLYLNDKNKFNLLRSIFNQYYEEKNNENPFIKYMKEEFNIENPKFVIVKDLINNSEFKIKKLRVIGDKITTKNTIVLNKQNNKAILLSLKSMAIRIYKNKKGKYITIPINQKVLSFDKNKSILKVDNEKLKQKLAELDVENNNYIEINYGTVFVNKNTRELFYSNGGGSLDKNLIELKALSESNDLRYGREQISLSTIMKNYNIVEVDELGNIYNEKEIML